MPAVPVEHYPQLLSAVTQSEKIVYLCGAGASMSLGEHQLSWTRWLLAGKSYLTETEQHNLLNSISYNDATPSLPQAIRLKEFSKEGKLSAEVIEAILDEEKPNQHEKISFKAERLRPYIPSSVPLEKTEDYIIKALEYYQRARERQKREQAR